MRNPPPKKFGPNLRRDGTRVFEDGSFENRRTGERGDEGSMPWTDPDTGTVYGAKKRAKGSFLPHGSPEQAVAAKHKVDRMGGAMSAKKEAAQRMLKIAKARRGQ